MTHIKFRSCLNSSSCFVPLCLSELGPDQSSEGFLQDIKRLRRDLLAAGAQTYTAPWPGCVRVLVFPEQLFNKARAAPLS